MSKLGGRSAAPAARRGQKAANSGAVFIHTSDEYYGADRMLLEILEAVPDGVPVEVWLPTDLIHPAAPLCEELTRRGVAVAHLDLPIMRRADRCLAGLARLALRAVRLRRELRRRAPAVVYCTTSAALVAGPVARIAGVPIVVAHLQEIWSGADRFLLAALVTSCRGLLAISEPVRAATPSRIRRRVVVVPNGVPDPGEPAGLDGHDGPLRFVVASRWNAWKGHGTLLAAWDQLDQGTSPSQLVVLGGPPASGRVVDVPAIVANLRHPESVSVVGERVDPYPYLNAADVVLMPSDEPEPFGLVAIEAFARARPVVASRGGGLVDIVSDGIDGWLFTPGDAVDLARVLSGLDRTAVAVAGTRARRTYVERYTSAGYRDRWLAAVERFGIHAS